jgi:hypothetical protein
LSSRPLDLYRALALPFSGDQEFCKSLANFIAQQRQFQPSLLSPVQASAVRVLHAFIHNLPTREGFVLSELTSEINLDLASCGEPSGLKERKVGDVLTSLGLTNRSRRKHRICVVGLPLRSCVDPRNGGRLQVTASRPNRSRPVRSAQRKSTAPPTRRRSQKL